MRDRDQPATRAIRRLMAAISNAEAVPQPAHVPPQVINPGDPAVPSRSEVPRAQVSPEDIAAILTVEIESLGTAIAEYDDLGATERSAELRHEYDALERYRHAPPG